MGTVYFFLAFSYYGCYHRCRRGCSRGVGGPVIIGMSCQMDSSSLVCPDGRNVVMFSAGCRKLKKSMGGRINVPLSLSIGGWGEVR